MPQGIAITFPSNPTEGQTHLAQNGFTYIYSSLKNQWKRGGDFVRAPKVLSFAGVAATTTGAGVTTGPLGGLIYNVPGFLIPSSDVGVDSYKAYRYTDSYPNYTEIQVSISSAFSSVAYAATSTSTTFSIPAGVLSANTTYYVRARQFVGSSAGAAATGAISGYSQNIVSFATTAVFLDTPTIVSIANSTQFPVYQIGFAGTTLPATVTYTGSGVGNLQQVEWIVTGPRNPDSTGDTALAEVGIGTFSSATLANALVLAMPFSGATGVGITNDVNGAIRTASGASAGTTKTITNAGAASTVAVGVATTTAHYYPSAAYFSGATTSYLSGPSSTDFNFGTGDFTIEFWIYSQATNTNPTFFRRFLTTGPDSDNSVQLGHIVTTTGVVVYYTSASTITGTRIITNRWAHIALVRKGTIVSLYVDGVLDGTATDSNNKSNQTLSIANYNNTDDGRMQGYMQDLKIYKGLAKYTENFTPPLPTYGTISYTTRTIGSVGVATTAFNQSTGDIPTAEVAIGSSTAAQVASSLVLAMPMNRTFGFQDINVAVRGLTSGASAGTAKTVGLGTTSTANAPSHPRISSTESKWYDGAAYFDGNDYVTALETVSDEFTFGTGDWTVEGWVYFNSISGTQCIVSTAEPTDSQGIWFGILSNKWYAITGTGSSWNGGDTGVFVAPNIWYHFVYLKTSGVVKVYINGIEIYSRSDAVSLTNTNNLIAIGGRTNASQYSNSYIQDLKIYKGFAKYTANFTPPQPICGFTTDLAIQTGFTTTSATGVALTSIVGLGSTSTLAFAADQTYAGITSITSSSGITTLPDPYAQNLVLALPLANITGVGNSFTNDRNTQIRSVSITGAGVTAGTTKTITNSGVTTVSAASTTQKWYSDMAYYNSTSDYLLTSNSSDFTFGTGDYTIEFWFYNDNSHAGNLNRKYLLDGRNSGTASFYIMEDNNTTYQMNDGNTEFTWLSNASLNRWYHFAVVRQSGSLRTYVDGVLTVTRSNTTNIDISTIRVGDYFGGGYGWSGYIQDFRTYKGLAKYTTNFTPPPPMFGDYTRSTPNKIVFTPGSDYVLEARNTATGGIVTSTYSATRQWGTKPKGGIYDPYGANLVLAIPGGAVSAATSTYDVTGQIRYETPTASYVNAGIVTYSNSLGIGTYGNKSVTNVGVALSTTQSKYYGRSMYFLGTGNLNSYLSVADSADFDFQGDWTIECWAYFTRAVGTQEPLWASNTDFKRPSVFRLTGGKMGYFVSSNGSSWDILIGDGAATGAGTIDVPSNQWVHVAFQRKGTVYTGYINGVVDISKSVAGTPFNAAEAFTIGRWGVSYSMQGHIQDFRIYTTAKYTSNFTPPNQIYLT